MKKTWRLWVLILLFFLGISALFGSYYLITDPTGESLQMPPSLLDSMPFENYLIPGTLLLIVNGIPALLIAFLTLFKVKYYAYLRVIQGIILIIWLTSELIININLFYPLTHITYYLIGSALIFLGLKLRKSVENSNNIELFK